MLSILSRFNTKSPTIEIVEEEELISPLLSLPLEVLVYILDIDPEAAWSASAACKTLYQLVVNNNSAHTKWLRLRNIGKYLERTKDLTPWPNISVSVDGLSSVLGNVRTLQHLHDPRWHNIRGLKIDFSQHSKQPVDFIQRMPNVQHLMLVNLHDPDKALPAITFDKCKLQTLHIECSRSSSIFNTEWSMHASPLAQLTHLTDLNISYADVPDLWAIRRLKLVRLTLSLHFTWHAYDDDFLQPVGEIKTLESFSIDGGITQNGIEVVSKLEGLKQLHIWPGPDELDLTPLCKLQNLWEITLLDKVHPYIRILAKMPNLRRITLLWINRPVSLECLISLPKLELVWVAPALFTASETSENMVLCEGFVRAKKSTKIVVDGVLVSGGDLSGTILF